MGTAKGLTVKFSSRGRTYTAKDLQGMSDSSLLDKVLVFVSSLPWKDEGSQQYALAMLGVVSKSIKDKERMQEQNPKGQGGRQHEEESQN